MRSFAQRSDEPELMDAPDVSEAEFAACLTDLAKVNAVTLARPPTLAWLKRATAGWPPGSAFSLLDVGFGQGDMLRAVDAWARRAGFSPRLSGIDLCPWSAPAARAATDPAADIDFRTGDIFASEIGEVDFIISSLVAHHMTDDQLVRFLAWMEAHARRGWFVNDLHRHPLAYYGFKALAAAAGWHRFVRHDGPVSVARAFRRADWMALLRAAEIPNEAAVVRWRFPFRFCVGRLK